ncbi:MAG: hypothetical protein OZSIB_1130 [Candidatus Ozemobacter sibiricus]|uniref:Uncharacterized protein n=1 Tax=Candidatus Ozemobacter sibiricus TaxID=2268124 RepID=A0A367ZLQ5_9BACT|nr:MAG: hypothetical protein OZSIB_1130 [Candidatus Ozemobacter sibiricus]
MKQLILPLLLVACLSFGLLYLVFNQRRPRPMPVLAPGAQTGGVTVRVSPTPAEVAEAVRRAEEAAKAGRFEEAFQALEKLQQEDDPRLQALLGEIQGRRGSYASAAVHFERALARKKEPAWQVGLAEALLRSDRPAAAEKWLAELEKTPLVPSLRERMLMGRAQAASATRDVAGALAMFQRLQREFPGSLAGFLEALRLLVQERPNDLPAQIASLREKGDARHSGVYDYHFWLAKAYDQAGKPAESEEQWRKASASRPEEPYPHQMLYQLARAGGRSLAALEELLLLYDLGAEAASEPALLPRALFQAALEAREFGRLDLAFRFLRASVLRDRSLLSQDDQGTVQAVAVHVASAGTPEEQKFMAAFQAIYQGEHREAAQLAEKLLPEVKDPHLRRDVETLLADCRKILSDEAAYRKYLADQQEAKRQAALASAAAAASAAARLAAAASGTPRTPSSGSPKAEQIARVKERLAAAKGNPAVLYDGGRELFALGDREGARAAFLKSLKEAPNLWEAHHCLALIAISEKNNTEAAGHLEQAMRLNPDHAKIKSLYAFLKLQMGDFPSAVVHAQRALELDAQDGQAHLVLADIYYRSKREDDAMRMVNQGLAVETDPRIVAALEALKAKIQGP